MEAEAEECGQGKSIKYNPYRHLRYESEETREFIRECGIRDLCKQHFPDETLHLGFDCNEVADQALQEVLAASKLIKLTACNPVKLFAYCFMYKSQLPGKTSLELLGLPLSKSGKQFSILNKGRQLHQQYRFALHRMYQTAEAPKSQSPSPRDVQRVKEELLAQSDMFGTSTIDVINKTADIIATHTPGVLQCPKRYKLLIKKIQTSEEFVGTVSREYAARLKIIMRNR